MSLNQSFISDFSEYYRWSQRTKRKSKLYYGWCTGRRFTAATRHNTSCSEVKYKIRNEIRNESYLSKLQRQSVCWSDRFPHVCILFLNKCSYCLKMFVKVLFVHIKFLKLCSEASSFLKAWCAPNCLLLYRHACTHPSPRPPPVTLNSQCCTSNYYWTQRNCNIFIFILHHFTQHCDGGKQKLAGQRHVV